MVYECIDCGSCYRIDQFLYTCPQCRSLLRLRNRDFASLKKIPGALWQKIFDYRKLLRTESLQGIFLFKEILFPTIPLQDIIYLGEGHTALVRANPELSARAGLDFFVKNDGFNPSASFKDRGMASAVSFINYSIRTRGLKEVLGICASTGDTSAAAALYLSYLDKQVVKSVVLLPQGRVTPQQLSQPLGSGALVIEIPGVFDDCMKIVEELAENYQVCLLNSKNPIRIMGQKSYAYEIAQQLCYNTSDLVVVVPIGNAGNVTAIMEGFLDLYDLNIIPELPCILGVQSTHANPVVQWQESGQLPADEGAAQCCPGSHDRRPGLIPQGAEPGAGPFSGTVYGCCGGGTADYREHAGGQSLWPCCVHPGRGSTGRAEESGIAGAGEKKPDRGCGFHVPSAQIFQFPAALF